MKSQLLIVTFIAISLMVSACSTSINKKEKPISFSRPERWKFLEPLDEEYTEKQKTIEAIDAFWKQFQLDEPKLSAIKNPDHYGEFWLTWSKEHLKKLDKYLNYEIGIERNDVPKNYLVISCDNYLALDPFVQTILERTPKLDDWNFYRYFSRYSHRTVEEAFTKSTDKKLSSFKFQCRTMPANLIGIIITAPTFHGDNITEDKNIAWEMLELTLGEKDLYTWIGAIETRKGASKLSTYVSSHRLQKEVAQYKRMLSNRLPDKPYYQIDLDEKTLSNLRISLSERPFASERFSKNQEIFCALASKDKNPFDTESKRDAFKDDLNKVLRDAKLGCVIDTYIEADKCFSISLCVLDAEKTIALLRKYCKEHSMPPNTYLFFYDETLASEWVALMPGADPYRSESKDQKKYKKKS